MLLAPAPGQADRQPGQPRQPTGRPGKASQPGWPGGPAGLVWDHFGARKAIIYEIQQVTGVNLALVLIGFRGK